MNRTEQRLWDELRKLKANFRRQAPIGGYFADFACHGRKLVIEVDGGVHDRLPEVTARDLERQRWLEGEGYRVLRFTDRQVWDNVHGVVDQIKALLPGKTVDPSKALLLDGGGLGGGGRNELTQTAHVGAGALPRQSRPRTASTTIPDPSSIEEEGR